MEMIPRGIPHQKPIDLRHKCFFSLGHIPLPAFVDIYLTRIARGIGWEPLSPNLSDSLKSPNEASTRTSMILIRVMYVSSCHSLS
jgi:hypothetical protein